MVIPEVESAPQIHEIYKKFGLISCTCDPLSYAKVQEVQNTVAVNQVSYFKNQSET